jgi:hypothetical protein
MVFSWFKRKVEPARREPTPAVHVRPVPDRTYFAREAMQSLGYLLPSAEEKIAGWINDQMVVSPDQTATAFRKSGEQLSDAEKKAAGIRKNAFMSRAAYAELTEKGRTKPLEAHEITLRRADFSMNRARNIARAQEVGCDQFEFSAAMDGVCKVCDAMDGTVTTGADAQIFPPAGCTCETGRYVLTAKIDFLSGLEGEYQ